MINRRFDCASSSRRLYQDVRDILVPLSPAPPSQACTATGVNTAGWKVSRLASLPASGRLMTSRYWPLSYTALPVAADPSRALSLVGPLAAISDTPGPFSQRSRYTASASLPIRKYGRSLPGPLDGGNCSAMASALPGSLDSVGSSQVRWKAISLSLYTPRTVTRSMEGLKFRGSTMTCPMRG